MVGAGGLRQRDRESHGESSRARAKQDATRDLILQGIVALHTIFLSDLVDAVSSPPLPSRQFIDGSCRGVLLSLMLVAASGGLIVICSPSRHFFSLSCFLFVSPGAALLRKA
jgi:hypothetical protein